MPRGDGMGPPWGSGAGTGKGTVTPPVSFLIFSSYPARQCAVEYRLAAVPASVTGL